MRAVVFNLGCKVNQYECAQIAAGLEGKGYEVFGTLMPADLFVINTCAVTAEAERKSRQIIARIRRHSPDAEIVVMGCASQTATEFYEKSGVGFVTGVAAKSAVLDNIGRRRTAIADFGDKFEYSPLFAAARLTRQYIKIQDGCNAFCSYCIIPHLRGRSRSRSIEDTLAEVRAQAVHTRELVLAGINLSQYGYDIGTNLTNLVLAMQDVDVRVRLGSFYAEGISDGLLQALKGLRHFCPHFHLSLQSGDDGVLADMRRRYDAQTFLQKVDDVRRVFPFASVTTDVIVGYPTETEEAFANTLRICETAAFADIHIFPYSRRSGTPAAALKPLAADVVRERKARLQALRDRLAAEYMHKMIGRRSVVIFENEVDGLRCGYSDEYLRVYAKTDAEMAEIIYNKPFMDGMMGEIL